MSNNVMELAIAGVVAFWMWMGKERNTVAMKPSGIVESATIDYFRAEDSSGGSGDGLDSEDLRDSMPELGKEFRFHGSLFPPEDIFRAD